MHVNQEFTLLKGWNEKSYSVYLESDVTKMKTENETLTGRLNAIKSIMESAIREHGSIAVESQEPPVKALATAITNILIGLHEQMVF